MSRTTRVLCAALIAASAAGCGSSTGTPPKSGAPKTAPSTIESRLDKAQDELRDEGHGRYQATVTAAGLGRPLFDELSDFDLDSETYSAQRIVANPGAQKGDPETYVIDFRMTKDHRMYMKMHDWGSWDGCWLQFRPKDLEKFAGIDVSTVPGMPVSVVAVLAAHMSGAAADGARIAATVPAGTALQLLGINPTKYEELGVGSGVDDVDVPIHIRLTGDRISTVDADGEEIYDALADAHVSLGDQVRGYLQALDAHVEFRTVDTVDIQAPDPRLLLPRDAKRSDTCQGLA